MLQRGPEPLLLEKGMNCVVYNILNMLKGNTSVDVIGKKGGYL